jgi:hypothetical protein
VFDLANLWLEQQPRQQQDSQAMDDQQTALAVLVWRRPVAADFLRCVAANLPWAADHVAASPQRPARLPASLDGKFSFTAEVGGNRRACYCHCPCTGCCLRARSNALHGCATSCTWPTCCLLRPAV